MFNKDPINDKVTTTIKYTIWWTTKQKSETIVILNNTLSKMYTSRNFAFLNFFSYTLKKQRTDNALKSPCSLTQKEKR